MQRVQLLDDCRFSDAKRTVQRVQHAQSNVDNVVCQAGKRVGQARYELVRPLSRGGMSAAVWIATDTQRAESASKRVIKFLPSDMPELDHEEMSILEILNHASICRLWDFIPECHALVLEHISGMDLAHYIQTPEWQQKTPQERFRFLQPIVTQVSEALDFCHGFQAEMDGRIETVCIVHLDVKPANIFLLTDHEGKTLAKLGDFGLGRIIKSGKAISLPGGTLPYMPPEQVLGFIRLQNDLTDNKKPIGPAVDIYALAATVYECISGTPLIEAENPETCASQILNLQPRPIPGLDEKTNRTILGALHRDPVRRPHTASEFAKRLDPALRITTDSLPKAYVDHAYHAEFKATGGEPPCRWSLQLPNSTDEFQCSQSGKLTGVPRSSNGVARAILFAVRVEDGGGRVDVRELQLTIEPVGGLRIVTHKFGAALLNRTYNAPIAVKGGRPPYTFTWEASEAPKGLTLTDDGVIAGRISADRNRLFEFNIKVTDADGVKRKRNMMLPAVPSDDFVTLTSGKYKVGIPVSEIATMARKVGLSEDTLKSHCSSDQVEVREFAIGKSPVSNAAYSRFIAETGYKPPPHWRHGKPRWWSLKHPVVNVSYEDASAFCRWRGSRLPTATEWDIAVAQQAFSVTCREWVSTRTPTPAKAFRCGNTLVALPPAENADLFLQSEKETQWWQHRRGVSRELSPYVKALPQHAPVGLPELESLDAAHCKQSLSFREVIDMTPVVRREEDVVPIPSGIFAFGPDDVKTSVSAFEIARYAVNNDFYAEYYRDYWQREWKYPAGKALHPAVGMSFEDARTFCAWLTKRDLLNRRYSLPSPLEWERAIKGPQGAYRYPWGNEYSRYRCNSIESGYGDTIRVFDLPMGYSSEGIANLCGNVSEFIDNNGTPEARGGDWLCSCARYGQANAKTLVPPDGHPRVGFRYICR